MSTLQNLGIAVLLVASTACQKQEAPKAEKVAIQANASDVASAAPLPDAVPEELSPMSDASADSPAAASQFPEIRQQLADGNFSQALSFAQAAVTAEPSNAQAHYLVGEAQFQLGKDELAIAAFDQALGLAPKHLKALLYRGMARRFKDDNAGARADFELAIGIDPSYFPPWFELAKLEEALRDFPAATRAMEKALELDPQNTKAMFSLGVYYANQAQDAKAIQVWERSLTLNPRVAQVHYNLGQSYQAAGRAEKALEHFTAVLELDPADHGAAKKIIQCLYALKRYDEAAKAREQFLALIAASTEPQTRDMKRFCFAQYAVSDGRFEVYEILERSGTLVYWYSFVFYPTGSEQATKSINVETSTYLQELGVGFILGQDEGRKHTTFGVTFKEIPPFEELQVLVQQAHEGKLAPSASSAPTPPTDATVDPRSKDPKSPVLIEL